MAAIEITADEKLLGKGECSMMVGPLSVIGELTLTSQRVHFEPNRLNKLVGIKPLTLRTDDIDKVEVVGIDRVITIATGDKTTKFMGKWAKAVHDRLQGQLSGTVDHRQTLDGFALDERYIVQTTLDYSATAVVMVGGDVTVTAYHLRFTPSALEKLMWRNLKVEVEIEAVEDLKLTGPRRLQFQVGEDAHRFAGAAATRVYAAIWAAQEQIKSARPSGDFVFEVAGASMQRGVLSHPGLLVQTRTGLTFLLGGALDALVGIPSISHYLWAEVSHIELMPGSRIMLASGAGQVVFTITNLPDYETGFLQGYSQVEGSSAQVLGLNDDPILREEDRAAASEIAAELVATWGARLPDLSDQTLALWGPALRVSRKVGCRRGHVAVFDEYVVWLPEGGIATGLNPIVLPIAKLQRIELQDKSVPGLRLRVGGGELHLMPPTQQRFNEPFWELVGDRAAEITLRQRDAQEAPSESPDVWNRRNTYRVGLPVRHHVPLEIRVVGTEEARPIAGRMTNLSLGGIGFASATTLRVGTDVLVTMPQGESHNTNFLATVIYSRQVGRRKLIFLGLEFTQMSPLQKDELRHLWTACQRIEVQIQRGMDEKDIESLIDSIADESPVGDWSTPITDD
jgi:hypothetical protein